MDELSQNFESLEVCGRGRYLCVDLYEVAKRLIWKQGSRARARPLLSNPLRPTAPLAPHLILLRSSPMQAQISFLGTGRSGSGSTNSSPSSSTSGSTGPQDQKETETVLTDSSLVDESKQSKQHHLEKVFIEYGAVDASLYTGMALISLGIFYLVVSSGVNLSSFPFKLRFAESLHSSKIVTCTSTFVMAHAIHKLFAPVRISITLFSLSLMVRDFGKVGFFKALGSKP
ncbi:protein FAM210B, mitochondrial-like [Petaurus breviceps papuanus]|uniref:protein FAM210B, mitochondrial-like n=1 Tax=Petaurus breviceps papuanus TaxID=3040969 RepID=UPI0036DBD73D